jgi:hypothetical protein
VHSAGEFACTSVLTCGLHSHGGGAMLLCQSKKGVRHIEQLNFIPTFDMSFIIVHLFEAYLNVEQDRQSTT